MNTIAAASKPKTLSFSGSGTTTTINLAKMTVGKLALALFLANSVQSRTLNQYATHQEEPRQNLTPPLIIVGCVLVIMFSIPFLSESSCCKTRKQTLADNPNHNQQSAGTELATLQTPDLPGSNNTSNSAPMLPSSLQRSDAA